MASRLRVLGSGNAFCPPGRFHPCMLLDDSILIDAPPTILHQLQSNNISSAQITDLLITHWKEDWHQDHRICHDVGNTLRRKQPLEVWYMNAFPYCQKYSTFESNVYSDISMHYQQKRKAIECYKNVNPRWAEDVESMSKFRGSFINVEHAEVFKADTVLF